MSVSTAPFESEERAQVSLTLAEPEARRLREVLPWLVHALEDRATLSTRQRERRRVTRTAIANLLTRLGETGPQSLADPAPAIP